MIMGGVVGPIKAYFGTVESQGRGSLHLHLLIWLDHDMKPTDMKEKIQNADFREKLKAYLEDIIKEDLDQFKDTHVLENFDGIENILFLFEYYFLIFFIVPRSSVSPPRLSRDNIYAALSTIDLTGLNQNTSASSIWSTPMKQQFSPSTTYSSPSIPYASPSFRYASPSIPYASPSIAYASPSSNKSLQTPTHDLLANGTVY
jgi:hypothetical protein